MFTPAAFLARIRAQPFIPFRVIKSSGETYDVVHPRLILVGHQFLEIGIPWKPGVDIFDQVYRVALSHITAVNDLPAPGGANGPA